MSGFVSLRGMRTKSAETWLRGGFGRLTTGANQSEYETAAEASADLVAVWKPSPRWTARFHLTGRDDAAGTNFGVTEAFIQRRFLHSERLRIRAGMLFLGTSRENIGTAWASPYTITLSAINSWVAEEVRPIGLDGEYQFDAGQNRFTAAATLFGGMDSAGSLLAWRGWSFGARTSTYNEVVPLPPLRSLSDPAQFGRQRSGTKPLGADLDGRPGWSARAGWELGRLQLEYTRLDNEGDRRLYDGQYAWRTAMNFWSGKVQLPGSAEAIAEYVSGNTGMGAPPFFVQADVSAGYVLLSIKPSRARFSIRYDLFRTADRDHSPAEQNSENGHAWTAACTWAVGWNLQLGIEYLQVNSYRPAVEGDPALDSRSTTVEVRYRF